MSGLSASDEAKGACGKTRGLQKQEGKVQNIYIFLHHLSKH